MYEVPCASDADVRRALTGQQNHNDLIIALAASIPLVATILATMDRAPCTVAQGLALTTTLTAVTLAALRGSAETTVATLIVGVVSVTLFFITPPIQAAVVSVLSVWVTGTTLHVLYRLQARGHPPAPEPRHKPKPAQSKPQSYHFSSCDALDFQYADDTTLPAVPPQPAQIKPQPEPRHKPVHRERVTTRAGLLEF